MANRDTGSMSQFQQCTGTVISGQQACVDAEQTEQGRQSGTQAVAVQQTQCLRHLTAAQQ